MKRAQKVKFIQEREEKPANTVIPKNDLQREFIEALRSKPFVCGIGCAGTGKTYIAGMMAAQALLRGDVSTVVLTRPNVPTGKTLGSFPGSVEEKLAPWLAPITNVLKRAIGPKDFECRFGKSILVQPLETIRGQSFENAFVIVDEAQNLSIDEIKALTTRVGEETTMAFVGDETQSDVKHGTDLTRFLKMCERSNIDVPVIRFGMDDIVRSELCAAMVRMFYRNDI